MTLLLAALLGLAALAAGLLLRQVRRQQRALDDRVRAIRRLQADLDEMGMAQERFFDLVTHELRSPLSAILGYQELLADGVCGCLDEQAAEPVERIGRSARHLVNLVEGVVELGRLRTGRLQPRLQTLDLGVLVSSVADAFRTQLAERGLEASVHLPDSLPAVQTDRDRLLRAFDLVVTSAVRHPAGDAMTLDVARLDDGVVARIAGTAIPSHGDAPDPAARLGIRLAVAVATAAFLGGELRLDTDDDDVIRALELRLGSAPAPATTASPATAALPSAAR